MKLINVEYLEESTTAIFFNVELESFWGGIKIKKAFMIKSNMFPYSSYFKWCDNTGTNMFDNAILQEMILKYEQRKL